jgi:tetratricopeptide (TPR) repeat protein
MKIQLFKALVALAAVTSLSSPAQARWLEAKTSHFTVVGDMSEADLRARTLELERYAAMLRYLLGVQNTMPVTVYEVEGMGAVQNAMGSGSSGVAGFYNASAQRAYAVVPERFNFDRGIEGFTPKVVLFHEYAHHMLLSNASVFMPGWAQEGLAEMFATAKIGDDGSVTIGDKNEYRGEDINATHRWTVKRMLESDFDPPKGDETLEKYSRGWAMVHYLWMSGERPNQYVDFIAELNRTVDPLASGEKAFGDLGKLDRELDRYIRAHKFNLSRFTAEQIGASDEVAIRPLTDGEAAMIDYRIASSVGVDEKSAVKLAERARPVGARYPNDLSVQLTMAEIEHDAKNYDASDAAADRALAIDPNSMFGMVYKGRVAMRRALAASNDEALVREARSWLRKAARANQNEALPFAVYYDSFGAVGETPPADAVAGLYRAVLLVPQDASLRVRAAIALLREGQVARARSILAPAAFEAEGSGENKALKLMKAMEETQDPQMLLAKAAELKLDQVNEFIEQDDEDEDDIRLALAAR